MAATDVKEVVPLTSGAPAAKAPKKAAAPKKKPATTPSHPKTYDMVLGAVKALKDRKGSSLQAIKKYISTTYKLDANKIASLIRRALKKVVTDGALVQTKGTGASGSFKVPAAPIKEAKKKPAAAAKKPAAAKKSKATKTTPKKPKAKRLATTPKKATKSPKKPKEAVAKKPKAVKKAKKSPSKPKAKKAAPKKQ